jgi:hypothetical protein
VGEPRCRPQPEQNVVEGADERRPVSVSKRLDERTPDRVLGSLRGLLARGK